MKPSEFKISVSVKSYDEKILKVTENTRCRKEHSLHQILIAQIENLNEDCVNILCLYHLYFPINKPSMSVTDGPGRTGSSF